MPDVQEVFRMATQKVRPEPGFVDRQFKEQRRRSRNRKVGALVAAAVIGIVAVVVVIRAMEDPIEPQPAGQGSSSNATLEAKPITDGSLEPGTYVIQAKDAGFDDAHRITVEVPEGYEGLSDAPTPLVGAEGSLGVYGVGATYTDACDWSNTATAISSADDLVAALAGQQALRPSAPTDAVVSGYAGTSMELTVPGPTKLDRCDQNRFQAWAIGHTGGIWLNEAGQHDLLWILDVDGTPVLIEVALSKGASEQDRAELEQMVESIQIQQT